MTSARQINIVINAIDRSEAILNRAERNISRLTKTAVAAAAAYTALSIGKQAIQSVTDYAEQVRKLSIETGLTTEQTSGMIFAAKQMGLSFSELAGPIGQLERRLFGIVDAQAGVSTGAKSGIQNLELYGIKTVDAKGKLLSFAQVLANIGDKLKSLPEGPEKTGLVESIASRAGASGASLGALISFLSLGTEGFNKFAAQAAKAGIVLGKDNVAAVLAYKQVMSQADAVVRGVEITIVSALLPTLTKLGLWFIAHQEDIQKFAKTFVDNMVKLAGEADRDVNFVIKLFQWFPDNQARIAAAILIIAVAFSGIGGAALVGLLAIIAALKWIPDNRARLVAEIIAIGVAFTIAFGPESAAVAALLLILNYLAQIQNKGEIVKNALLHLDPRTDNGVLDQQINEVDDKIKHLNEQKANVGVKQAAGQVFPFLKQGGAIGNVLGKAFDSGSSPGGPNAEEIDKQIAAAEDKRADLIKKRGKVYGPDSSLASTTTPSPDLPPPGAGETFPFPDKETKEKVDEFAKLIEDAMEDGIISLKEFKNINQQAKKQGVDPLSVSEAALMEARYKEININYAAEEAAYDLQKATVKLTYAATKGSKEFAQFESDVVDTMNELLDAARSAVFEKPTRQQADNSLALARIDEEIAKANLALKPVTDARDAYIAGLEKEKDALNGQKDDITAAMELAHDTQAGILESMKTALDNQKAPENTQHYVARRFEADTKAFNDQHDAAVKQLEAVTKGFETTYDGQKKMVEARFKAELDANDLQTHQLETANKNALVQWQNLHDYTQLEGEVLSAHQKVQQALLDSARQDLVSEGDRQKQVDKLAQVTTDVTTDFASVHATLGDTLIPAYDRNVKAIDGYTASITAAAAKIDTTVANIAAVPGPADAGNPNAYRTA